MELKEFVAESLRQIIDGVQEAQGAPGGTNVNANSANAVSGTNIFSAGSYGTFTLVQFDIAVSAEASGKAGGGLKVWGLNAEAGAEKKTGNVSRIAFAVPVRLPDGDQVRAQNVRARQNAAMGSARRDRDDF